MATVVIVIYALLLALANALGYYFWDIVKSAYKQIKEENENSARGNISSLKSVQFKKTVGQASFPS